MQAAARALYHDPMPVGGIAVALVLGTSALLEVPVSGAVLAAGFSGTALVYGVDRVLTTSPEDAINRPDRRRWVRAHRNRLWIEMGLLLGVVGVSLPFLRPGALLVSAGLALVVGLHLLPGDRWGRPLQKIPLLKPVAVAGAWAVGSTLVPLLDGGETMRFGVFALGGYRMLFILPNVLLADWADREGDAAVGLAVWTPGESLYALRLTSTVLLTGGIVGAVVAVHSYGAPAVLLVDVLGLIAMLGATWGLRPWDSPAQAFMLDLIVAWPLVPWLVHQWGGL